MGFTKPLSEVLAEYPQLRGPPGDKGDKGDQGAPGTNASLAWVPAGTWTYAGAPAANVIFASLGAANEILIEYVGVTFDAATFPSYVVSADNGATFFSASGNYLDIGAAGLTTARAQGRIGASANTGPFDSWAIIHNWNAARRKQVTGPAGLALNLSAVVAVAQALNAIKLMPNAANFNAGTINVYTR